MRKKGVAIEGLVWWIIAIGVLAIVIVFAVVLKSKGLNLIDYIKDLFRFR